MYKIVMAENHQQSIEVVKRVVDSVRKKVVIVEIVNSGFELLTKVEEIKPEIVLINVDIIGINGLEAAKRIRMNNNEIHIVLFSEYDYFDFVKEAINCKADDYILKPIQTESLLTCLDKIIETLDKKKEKSQFREVAEFIEYGFIHSLLCFDKTQSQLKKYQRLLGLHNYGYFIFIEIDAGYDENSIDDYEVVNKIKAILDLNSCIAAVGPRFNNQWIVFISIEDMEAYSEENSIELASKIKCRLEDMVTYDILIGIGSAKKIDDIYSSYWEAQKSIRYNGKTNLTHINTISNLSININDYNDIENNLIENIKLGKDSAIAYFYDIMDMLRLLSREDRINKIIELFVLINRETRVDTGEENHRFDYIRYIHEISILPLEQIESWFLQRLENLIKIIRCNRNDKKSIAIKEAIHYMKQHYKEEISLDDLSQYIGISPQHLSKLFKEETGINYVEWLTNLRIDMAKQLLTEGGQTVKEICYLVGYHDPNYFSRIFKKIVGISPTDYIADSEFDINNSN